MRPATRRCAPPPSTHTQKHSSDAAYCEQARSLSAHIFGIPNRSQCRCVPHYTARDAGEPSKKRAATHAMHSFVPINLSYFACKRWNCGSFFSATIRICWPRMGSKSIVCAADGNILWKQFFAVEYEEPIDSEWKTHRHTHIRRGADSKVIMVKRLCSNSLLCTNERTQVDRGENRMPPETRQPI